MQRAIARDAQVILFSIMQRAIARNAQDSGLAVHNPGYVEIDCCDHARFKTWAASELYKAYDALLVAEERHLRGEITAAELKNLIQAVGFNPNKHGLMADHALRRHIDVAAVATYDWMHSALQDGVLTTEVSKLLQACRPHGVTYDMLQAYFASSSWRFCKHKSVKGSQLHRVFDQHRNPSEPNKIKANCAEMLGIFGILRHFVETKIADIPELRSQRLSFFAACEIIDILMSAKRSNSDINASASRLRDACNLHIQLHVCAYGTGGIRPKHHWLMDVPEQVLRSGCVLDAFVLERSHLRVKSIAEHVKNTVSYETSVLSGLLNCIAQSSLSADGLRGRQCGLPGSAHIVIADAVTLKNISIAVGDVVMLGQVAAVVKACVNDSGVLGVVVDVFTTLARPSRHTMRCKLAGASEIWHPHEVAEVIAWYVDDNCVVVLH